MITVAGLSPSLDLTYLVDSLRLGAIHRPTAVVRCAGGKSLNMARAAATLGAASCVVAILGGATGAWLAEMLRNAGIDVVVVESPAQTRTCVSIAAADSGELTELYEQAAPVPDSVWLQFQLEIESVIAHRPGWLCICGGAPTGLSPDAIADIVRLGARLNARVAVDTHSAALPQAVGARPALVKVNRLEAADLLGVPADSDLLGMARAIRATTHGTIVLTDGKDGALGLDGDGAVHARIPSMQGRFPVGSGDSFLGGLLAGLDRGQRLGDALRQATAAGVANAMVPGPGRFERDAAEQLNGKVILTDVT